MNVSLFVTCLGDLFAPDVGMATVKVLEHFGCKVDFPEDQTCCGQPQYNNGYPGEARTLAEPHGSASSRTANTSSRLPARAVRGWSASTTHCCLRMTNSGKTTALEFVAKTYALVEVLTKVLKVDVAGLTRPQPTAITYHYTCHTRGLHMNEGAGD